MKEMSHEYTGVQRGCPFYYKLTAGRDEDGNWLEIRQKRWFLFLLLPNTVRLRPDQVAEFANDQPGLFRVLLKCGVHCRPEESLASDRSARERWSREFMKAFQKAANHRQLQFFGPVGILPAT